MHSVHSRPWRYTSNLDLKRNNTVLPMATHPGSYRRPRTHIQHTHSNISVHAHKPQQIIKTLTETGWGKQKETLMATYKTVKRPALEYAYSI